MGKEKWTVENIPDISGKVVVVTGANVGLGVSTVKALAAKGADVVLCSRSMDKGNAARDEIIAKHKDAKVTVMQLDLSDLSSIKTFADSFMSNYNSLDVLVNNAGVMMCPKSKSKDGFELQIGVNHLGHYALTGHLLEILKKTPSSRIVNVSSLGHRNCNDMSFDDFMYDKPKAYKPTTAYYRSKLANLLFTHQLQRKLEEAGINCICMSAHPGVSETNLMRHVEDSIWFKAFAWMVRPLCSKPDQGALPQIRAAVDPSAKGAAYYGPNGFHEFKGYPILVQSTETSHRRDLQEKLWEVSQKLTGISYQF